MGEWNTDSQHRPMTLYFLCVSGKLRKMLVSNILEAISKISFEKLVK